jgi:hypothetical protein
MELYVRRTVARFPADQGPGKQPALCIARARGVAQKMSISRSNSFFNFHARFHNSYLKYVWGKKFSPIFFDVVLSYQSNLKHSYSTTLW